MSVEPDDTATEYDQHSSDPIAYDSAFQCSDGVYALLLKAVKQQIVEERGEQEHIDFSQVQLRKVVWEDGVLSYQATHPHAVHEDHTDGEIGLEELEEPTDG